jgi:hypothetical protein
VNKSPLYDGRAGGTPAPRAWREALTKELVRRKLPSAWQDRLMEELDDHYSDLMEENMNAVSKQPSLPDQRLGAPHEIAAAAGAEYRRLGFFARRPLLTYVAGPLVLVPLTVVIFIALGIGVLGTAVAIVCWLTGTHSSELNSVAGNFVAQALVFSFRFIPFVAAAWFFCRLARYHGRSWRSVLVAGTITSFYALFFTITLTPKVADHEGLLMVGLSIPPTHLLNFLQAAVPLVLMCTFLWRTAPGSSPVAVSAEG